VPRFSYDDVLRRLFIGALFATLLANGAVGLDLSALAATTFGALLAASSVTTIRRPRLRLLRLLSLALAVVVTAAVVHQVQWDPTGAVAHPVWRELADAFGETGGSRSMVRRHPIWEIPGTILPFLVFATAIGLFRSEEDVGRLWRAIAVFGAVFAVYGLAQAAFFPTWHFGPRVHYLGSVTGFYVNRNAAASLLLATALVSLVRLGTSWQHIDTGRLRRLVTGAEPPREHERRLLFDLALVLVQVAALLLTRSRAGSVLGIVALAGFAGWQWRFLERRLHRRPSRRVVLAVAAIVGLFVVVVGLQLIRRLDVQGLDDSRWCVYPAMLRLVVEAWPWGTGLGTFPVAFAPHRPIVCGLNGIWDRAHDTYIQGLVTLGWVFPVVVAISLAAILPPLVRGSGGGRTVRPVVVATLVLLAAAALHSLVDFPLEIPGNAVLAATLVASAIGLAVGRENGAPRRGVRGDPGETDAAPPASDGRSGGEPAADGLPVSGRHRSARRRPDRRRTS
jgi:hypothetical protein